MEGRLCWRNDPLRDLSFAWACYTTQAGHEMYVRKESPSKCFTSTDLRLKVGDAKKLSFNINIGKNQESKSTLQVFMWYYVYL